MKYEVGTSEDDLDNAVKAVDRTAFWCGAVYMREQCFKLLNKEQMQALMETTIAELYEKYLKDIKKR